MLPPVETETVMISSKLSFPLCILIKTKTKKHKTKTNQQKLLCAHTAGEAGQEGVLPYVCTGIDFGH